MEHKLT